MSGREANLFGDGSIRIRHHARHVATADVRLYDDAPLAVLAADLVRSIGDVDVRNRFERYEPALGKRHRHLTQRLEVGTLCVRHPDRDGKPAVAFEDHTGIAPTDCGGDGVLHRLRADAQPRHRVTTGLDIEHG